MIERSQEFELRLNSLEGENRRLRRAVGLLAVSIGVLLGLGFHRWQEPSPSIPASPEVQAQRFVLVDSRGHEQAVLGVGPNGPFLNLLGTNPNVVPVAVNESGLVLRGSSGLGAALDAGGLEMDSPSGHTEVKARSLSMQPASSAASVHLQVAGGGPSLVLQDASGNIAAIGVHAIAPSPSAPPRRTSAASIALVSSEHRILWSAPPLHR